LNGTLLGSLETEHFINRNITDLCLIESISLCSGSIKKNNFIFIRKHGVRVKNAFLLTCACCCCLLFLLLLLLLWWWWWFCVCVFVCVCVCVDERTY
jgi:Ca2+/Na+ antiporter